MTKKTNGPLAQHMICDLISHYLCLVKSNRKTLKSYNSFLKGPRQKSKEHCINYLDEKKNLNKSFSVFHIKL